MRSSVLCVALVFTVVSSPRSLAAQTMVTFEVPVKLTQLAPEILEISLYCEIKSQAIVAPNPGLVSGTDDVPVVAGQLTTTMRVVITLDATALQAPVGKTANYTCYLRGKTATGLGGFSDTAPNPIWVLKPNPAAITGTFVW